MGDCYSSSVDWYNWCLFGFQMTNPIRKGKIMRNMTNKQFKELIATIEKDIAKAPLSLDAFDAHCRVLIALLKELTQRTIT